MTLEQAASILKQMYQSAPVGDKAVRIHLFGIQYASELDGLSLKEIVVRAGISHSYHTEISKGRRLAEYVRMK
jgi:hypothetical protein